MLNEFSKTVVILLILKVYFFPVKLLIDSHLRDICHLKCHLLVIHSTRMPHTRILRRRLFFIVSTEHQEGHFHIVDGTCLGCVPGYIGPTCDKSVSFCQFHHFFYDIFSTFYAQCFKQYHILKQIGNI